MLEPLLVLLKILLVYARKFHAHRWTMTVKHIVLFQFKADARPEAIQEVCPHWPCQHGNRMSNATY